MNCFLFGYDRYTFLSNTNLETSVTLQKKYGKDASEHVPEPANITEKVHKEAYQLTFRKSHQRFLQKKLFLRISQNSQKNTCVKVSFLIKKETLAQVFSCEFWKKFKNTFCTEHVWTTASGILIQFYEKLGILNV